ncbi:MAG: TetR/AcrR family transcriptional regulator [Spirochaetales bacterium]|nr:TetR/AcrR family transcriptional regulator [Leptospiraceae bacterium]MCP5480157.1 TetR/AcrR family transcriptional regulator [Spirochaetales bacterium]
MARPHNKPERTADILSRTIPVVQRRGYHATGVAQLVDAAGIPKGSFFYYFESKERFALAALEQYTAQALRETARHLEGPGRPGERVRRMYRARILYARQQLKANTTCLMNTLAQEIGAETSAVSVTLGHSLERMRLLIEACLEGTALAVGVSAREAADILESAWRGTLLVMRGTRSTRPLSSFETLLDVVLAEKKQAGVQDE